jgi:hypothetical protein
MHYLSLFIYSYLKKKNVLGFLLNEPHSTINSPEKEYHGTVKIAMCLIFFTQK